MIQGDLGCFFQLNLILSLTVDTCIKKNTMYQIIGLIHKN